MLDTNGAVVWGSNCVYLPNLIAILFLLISYTGCLKFKCLKLYLPWHFYQHVCHYSLKMHNTGSFSFKDPWPGLHTQNTPLNKYMLKKELPCKNCFGAHWQNTINPSCFSISHLLSCDKEQLPLVKSRTLFCQSQNGAICHCCNTFHIWYKVQVTWWSLPDHNTWQVFGAASFALFFLNCLFAPF